MTERFVSPGTPPTPYQREAAEILIEECAEISIELGHVQQRATKLLRFGVDEVQPGQPDDNARRLGMEIGDLMETIDMALEAGIATLADIEAGRQRKRPQLAKFVQRRPI